MNLTKTGTITAIPYLCNSHYHFNGFRVCWTTKKLIEANIVSVNEYNPAWSVESILIAQKVHLRPSDFISLKHGCTEKVIDFVIRLDKRYDRAQAEALIHKLLNKVVTT